VLVWMLVLMLVVLNFMEVVVSGNGHTDDQQHGLVEAELLVLVQIKVLHDFINGGLVFHMLQRKGCVRKLLLNQELQLALGQGV
ncbi:hypothetical protein N320_04864, partial [Buceros rhinoceros silvestris]